MVLSKFDSLFVRPPTPPKDLEDHAHDQDEDEDETLQFLNDHFGQKPVLPRIIATKSLLNTPEQSPSSDISIPSSSACRRKRVNFELQTCAIPSKKAIVQSWTPTRSSPLRPLPQTRVSLPLKSILKPSDGTPTPPPADDGATAHKFKTFADMLESIVKLLASADRSSRLDAYHSLQRTMQAYDKIPDEQALKHKMSLLTQFIRRDVQSPSPTGTGLDSQLVAQALKLLMALFRITDLTSAMDDDFCSFIMERVIHVASDVSMPKAIVNTHLAVLMQQNFRLRTMTTNRIEKILDALDTIHERISGFSVQAYRIRIYRKLIQQRPDLMIKHTERWFKHTVKALVSPQKDINQSALDTALSAAKTIGHDRHVAKSVLSVLNRVRNDGETFARVLTWELERMLGGDNATMVPQIWSAVTGLLRDSLNGQMFSAMKDWLEVFEKCLKSDKDQVKMHANVAFCFLLYVVNLAANTSEGWTKMFLNIPLHQLKQRIPAKKADRDAITSGYVTLLYYALRPTASFEQLDRYWTEFVAGFWNPLIHSSSTQQAIAACRVVSALLNGSRKPWNEHRALDLRPQYMTQRGELPLVDPKWVRKSLCKVLQFVETLLDATPWTESEQQEDEPVKTMWLAVMDALVEASSKEVMASSETKDAMAHIINLLRRIWDRHTTKLALPQQKEDLWADKFCFLIETVVQKLGAFQFADKCLMRNGNNEFEVASTPSHRARQQGARTSPLLYLVDLLINQSEGKLADSVRLRAIKLIIEPCFNVQNTRFSKLELLRDCGAAVDGSLRAAVALNFWAQTAALLQSSIQEQLSDSNERVSRPFGKEYELVVDLLGLGSAYMLNMPRGQEVLSAFVETVRCEAGEGAVILAVIEKVSERVLKRTADEDKASCLPYTSILLRNLPKQMSRRVLDQGRQNIWPSSPATGRHPDFDPYSHLYGAVISTGSAAYQNLNSEDVEPTKRFLAAFASSIHHCSTSHLAVYLRKTQDMIRLWVEDSEKKLQSKEQPLKSLHREVVNLWKHVSEAIERLPRKDSQILLHLEPLITAGFLSMRRGIVNISIVTWNSTFGKEESLRYPSHLEQALRRLRNTVEIALPSLEVHSKDAVNELSFYDSDTSTEHAKHAFKSPRVKESPFKVSKSRRKSVTRSPAASTPGSRRASARQTSKARLRHDNSQIQFEPIVSSPSNPFSHESQVLTDRQKEIVERQRHSTGLFANMGAVSPLRETVPSPMEIHSDALDRNDLPNGASRTTPLKALAAMGPMDVFLGSSPTPYARRSTQHIVSDDTSVATPTAVRTIQLTTNDDLGSSPPRFEKDAVSNTAQYNHHSQVGSSFEYQRPENSYSVSFDEGTTIDEESLLDTVLKGPEHGERSESDFPSDTVMSELPSSTIDLQLTAQIDADMQTHADTASQPISEAGPKSITEFVDAASHQQPSFSNVEQAGSDAEVEDSQLASHPAAIAISHKEPEFESSSTSRVGDSFSRPASGKGTPTTRNLRRSSRHSTSFSPAQQSSGKKRKQTHVKHDTMVQKEKEAQEEQSPAQSSFQSDEGSIHDNIVVVSPQIQNNPKKRKPMSNSDSSANGDVIVPETSRKRGTRRSQSLLSQVENSQDVIVEDTPAPKRARQSMGQDVSEAKNAQRPKGSKATQTKRLSHVQIKSKHSSEYGPSVDGSPTDADVEQPISHLDSDQEIDIKPQVDATKPSEEEKSQRQSPQDAPTGVSTPSRSFAERVILTPRSIINQLKSLKDFLFSAPQLVLAREEEREIDDVLFDIRRQVHAAGQRG
ncbi:uncharacterized protein K460DRAFT_337114 [Cucurbitaria berberidis CBS 394.84]|uniref:Telomere-associated protein Rif1 N-terminal domain-containing protein n=1 Tax=Cucurbitaria berberidis CBS 394.84 TaxID=1168544 RepID=A0A9P4GH75_9PLEO|nr:uncharacterized protein K460DRAFT_337114 [Cucurbitaria berberidis CBS 394.84]KAF1845184.1 hypothetical protein K460DRAFT_337114 [Cucurbitaria berberidis CBS 394.84]